MSEDQYFEMRERLERLSEHELARFRAAPENQASLRAFDEFVWAQAFPYLAALVVVLAVSVTAAWLLAV